MSSGSSNSQQPATTTAPSSTSPGPTTSTTPATTQSSPSSASSSTTGTTSSHTTSASSTSTSSATTTQSTTTTSTPLTTAQFVTTSGDTAVTITSVITTAPAATSTSGNRSSSNSFFSNTAAVAGVFTAVGLVALVLVIVFIVNAVRRRRAQKFDRDVAEAAAEAAASSRSPFDDYSYGNARGNSNGGSGGGYGYSDNSHGTYQTPPLQPSEQYHMTEMSQYDPYAAGAASMAAAAAVGRSRSRKDSETGAPGIAGVGAGTLAREPSKRAPYNAFAGPGPQPHELQASNGTMRSRRNQDVLEAAGLAAVARKPSEATQNTHFSSRSQQFGSTSSHHQPNVPGPLQPGYPVVDSYYPQRHDTLSPDPFAAAYPPPVTTATSSASLPNPHEAVQQPPSPPLPGHQSDHNEDIGETGSPTALRSDEQRMSYQDDVDYSQGHRVLRVANE